MTDRTIAVYADWSPGDAPIHLGTLHARPGRNAEIFSFALTEKAIGDARLSRQRLDPDVAQGSGPQYPRDGRTQFGMFADASPDRWGRRLIDRRFAQLRRSGALPASVRPRETDYLLGVHDPFRSGALRFKLNDDGPFLADDAASAAPPFVRLRELEAASRALESEAEDDPHLDAQLQLLLAPGASLGGARPKATVCDPGGSLWIAKFPSESDRMNIGAWEYVVHRLAQRCEIVVPDAELRRFGERGHTFLVRRFDRVGSVGRIHFASAMTLTGHRDGDQASYVEIAEVLASQGAEANRDLAELWARIVFNVLVSNTDDHLRNHGFLLTAKGWRLAPAFDMNPNPFGTGLALDIDEADNALDLELVRSVAPYFRVRRPDEIIERLQTGVAAWREIATEVGIARSEQELMASAFELAGRPSTGSG